MKAKLTEIPQNCLEKQMLGGIDSLMVKKYPPASPGSGGLQSDISSMRQGRYEFLTLREDGRVYQHSTVDGKPVLVAKQGETFRVKFLVHPDESGSFTEELVFAALYVDGVFTERVGWTLTGSKPVEFFFAGFRKSVNEALAFTFNLPEVNTVQATEGNSGEFGTLKVVVNRGEAKGRFEDRITPNSVPDGDKILKEDAKFWKQASLVTVAGRCVESKLSAKCSVWNIRQELATLTLPYHSADTVDFLQKFHAQQRQREALAEALRQNRHSLTGDAEAAVVDLTEGDDREVEIKREKIAAAVAVDLTGEGDEGGAGTGSGARRGKRARRDL